ncbi:NAD(P)-dependent alcohol dehydrogenase [Pseudomonas gingeri NCPPB 3146 = LMG 5327]|uniref:NAD(P)-dependent alcohol dehydrogenase n=2 Tax=Pseudomonas gingeri TaxID=117681 RepID=A0A7Y7XZG4_9PSED|nr:NAD(P)-dependent alcohol dehydrogenase [Pseudomonas gingeri]NVZ23976.1 NAD(P)-dependent alcohol dehydrogenase [Pseudomonas gingeri]NWC13942.1 NAD(P)-dependent alcohol dehydrogenase [Pseudomonas gingeri]NWE71871.1 NAD(P)-dependent alcohol dehydrogenase [Pseudomonas gingeri]PNQ88857.1 NAD(P)-dependent alcohol dehydrogenase [Pseudomonas gingeri NCPPB 3146 = LMG 5327]
MAQALVLESPRQLALREIELPAVLGTRDVRIRMDVVGICGSDIHYYRHGRIGPFVVDAPMVLGHEAAGTVLECGAEVVDLSPGDRVCIEPGIPDFSSRPSRIGQYNLDPSLTFWATPPIHGCLTSEVIHPATLVYRLPATISQAEGAMVEPLAVGMQAATKAGVQPGDVALVLGAGTIGILTALCALAAGCARVLIFDPAAEKLQNVAHYPGIEALTGPDLSGQVAALTQKRGVDLVFECSGAAAAFVDLASHLRPGGTVICVGMPASTVALDIVALMVKEIRLVTVFRYANVYERAIALLASGKIDVKPLITASYPFDRSIEAFERADQALPRDVKLQITLPA